MSQSEGFGYCDGGGKTRAGADRKTRLADDRETGD
jgi:hypothetical protein